MSVTIAFFIRLVYLDQKYEAEHGSNKNNWIKCKWQLQHKTYRLAWSCARSQVSHLACRPSAITCSLVLRGLPRFLLQFTCRPFKVVPHNQQFITISFQCSLWPIIAYAASGWPYCAGQAYAVRGWPTLSSKDNIHNIRIQLSFCLLR